MDPTVAAIPAYFGTMGVGSIAAPMVVSKLLGPITPGKGKYGRAFRDAA